MFHRPSLTAALLLSAACATPSPIELRLQVAATHERYGEALKETGLDATALGRDWLAEADRALREPFTASTPFIESGVFPADRPTAVAYRLELVRGRRLSVEIAFDSTEPGRLFVDLFQEREGDTPRRVGGSEAGQWSFEHDVRATGTYIVRLQPELLRFGKYTVMQRSLASYVFPIPGRSLAAVQSRFGAPRDGGARDHHGIDIFAPRGTPVIAIADGVVRIDDTPRGGRVVWLRDSRLSRNLYYAHLDDWAVENGVAVKAGDIIGFVGNTGNARTTPPHLHFGIYERGPTDPEPFLWRDDPHPSRILVSLDPLGDRLPDNGRVLAARRNEYRVLRGDGTFDLLSRRELSTQ